MTSPTDRRLWLAAGVAAVAGLGVAWQRQSERAERGGGADEPAGLWTLTFEQPGGGTLAMRSLKGRPLLINFWATWCEPCIRELPELQRFRREFAANGWQVLALAIDHEKAVLEFLARMPLDLTVALGGVDGIDLGRALGNHRGGLPFSVLLDARGRIAHRKIGQTHFDELAGWARGMARR